MLHVNEFLSMRHVAKSGCVSVNRPIAEVYRKNYTECRVEPRHQNRFSLLNVNSNSTFLGIYLKKVKNLLPNVSSFSLV